MRQCGSILFPYPTLVDEPPGADDVSARRAKTPGGFGLALVADEAADDRTGRRSMVASRTRAAELVTDDSADDGTQDGAGADAAGFTGLGRSLAHAAALLVGGDLLGTALAARLGDAIVDRRGTEDARDNPVS